MYSSPCYAGGAYLLMQMYKPVAQIISLYWCQNTQNVWQVWIVVVKIIASNLDLLTQPWPKIQAVVKIVKFEYIEYIAF